MSKIFVMLTVLFFHVLDDFVLQQFCLAKLKQKDFWKENAPDEMYKHDYMCALIIHAFSWAFMIMLPIAVYKNFNVGYPFLILLLFNMAMHAVIDHVKANIKATNLWYDQSLHIILALITAWAFLSIL